jgi:phosphoribosylformylglycinamidine (FGAM) synthase-like amidotransferase family enzyme
VVVIPGGFSYGDYLRAGAIARFAPIMTEVIEFARAGGYVMGICNGFQVCCEAGLLPGALLTNVDRASSAARSQLEVVNADTPFTARPRSRRAAVDPRQAHDRALLRAAADAGAPASRRPGRAALRAGQNPNGSLDDIAGVINEAATCSA